jgi:nucleotide-binding universal stress UspA family protein
MFTQILIPLDGSTLAERALPYAQQLALPGATLHLVRVVDVFQYLTWSPFAPPLLPATVDEMVNAEYEAADAYLHAVQQRLPGAGVRVAALEVRGNAAQTLLDYEGATHIDLVVMATHGRSGLARFALGSVADQLVHHGSVPLLLVHAFGTPATLERLLVPLDGSPLAEQGLAVARTLASQVACELLLLHVIGKEEERPGAERYLAEEAQYLRAAQIACAQQVTLGNPAAVILDAAGNGRTIVMATHGRSGPARWALGSVADRVAHHTQSAVLLIRAGAVAAHEPLSTATAAGIGR